MDFPSNAELIEIIKNGEDSTVEFKKEFTNREQNFSAELVAFANSKGGFLLLGVGDNGSIYGIERNHPGDLKNKISNLCNEIKPPIDPVFKIYSLDNKQILVILVESGQEKPYCTNKMDYWIKRGDSKRKAAPSDLRRLVKEGAKITEDERITAADIENALNESKFRIYFETYYLTQSNQDKVPLKQLIQNFRLADNAKLNVAGLLLFGKQIQNYLPNAIIRLIAFYGNNIEDRNYIEKIDAQGSIDEQFSTAMAFLKRNLKHVAVKEGFNSNSSLEISTVALEEAIVNALVHRDYSFETPVKIFLFKNRLEIKSPGALVNHLNIENIKNGNSIARNPILVSHGKNLSYTGAGSGVKRIIQEESNNVEFINNTDEKNFCVVFGRK